MEPEYIASKLAMLPQFEVTAIHRRSKNQAVSATLDGYFSETMIAEEQAANLFLSDLRFLDGLLLASDSPDFSRSIDVGPYAWSEIMEKEVLGAKLAYFGANDRRRLNLVINPAIAWHHTEFKPRPALESFFIGTDGKSYRRTSEYIPGTEVPEGSRIIELDWDHEHCVFCWETINSENPGFFSRCDGEGDGEWVCESCYRDAVETCSPRALILHQIKGR